ncbi:winged helix-turn-helix domain-containing protein [Ferroplasma sp.]|uniref:winged helix-turn-helix domain-containing protein n=1 Tax=Ferroplasma sp. TaxID=2591003 RepID=UPI00307F9C55
MNFPDEFHRILWWLLIATRGGPTRTMILEILKDNPENLNKIAETLKINYRTVQHHIKILMDNAVVQKEGNGYGSVYFLSDYYQKNYQSIMEHLKNK